MAYRKAIAEVEMIRQAAEAQRSQRNYLARRDTHHLDKFVEVTETVYEVMRELLVDKLRYMDDEQFIAAVNLTESDILPELDEMEQDRLEYEYQLEHNI